jgi:hypothetical protein
MSDFRGFEHIREYRFREWLRFTKTRPYVCQPLMKNFWQCFDHFHFDKNMEEADAKTNCLEKFNYEECFNENKEKLIENRKYNFNVVVPSSAAGEEEEEE